MPRHVLTAEERSRGGINGGKKPANRKKAEEWDTLKNYMLKGATTKVKQYLDTLEGEDFYTEYCKLLNYFKPKMQSTQLESKGEININIIHPDTKLLDKI